MYKERMGPENPMSWSASLVECKPKAKLHTKQEKPGTKGYMNQLCTQHKSGGYVSFPINNNKKV